MFISFLFANVPKVRNGPVNCSLVVDQHRDFRDEHRTQDISVRIYICKHVPLQNILNIMEPYKGIFVLKLSYRLQLTNQKRWYIIITGKESIIY